MECSRKVRESSFTAARATFIGHLSYFLSFFNCFFFFFLPPDLGLEFRSSFCGRRKYFLCGTSADLQISRRVGILARTTSFLRASMECEPKRLLPVAIRRNCEIYECACTRSPRLPFELLQDEGCPMIYREVITTVAPLSGNGRL